MNRLVYRYTFKPELSLDEVEATIVLSILAAESLHGADQVRLDAAHFFDRTKRACVIDADTAVGKDLNRLFLGFVRREFGEDGFRVERMTEPTRRDVTSTATGVVA